MNSLKLWTGWIYKLPVNYPSMFQYASIKKQYRVYTEWFIEYNVQLTGSDLIVKTMICNDIDIHQ